MAFENARLKLNSKSTSPSPRDHVITAVEKRVKLRFLRAESYFKTET